jgi:amidase
MRAYCHREAEVNDEINCITECRFSQAISEARELDEWFERNDRPKGVLHGVITNSKLFNVYKNEKV